MVVVVRKSRGKGGGVGGGRSQAYIASASSGGCLALLDEGLGVFMFPLRQLHSPPLYLARVSALVLVPCARCFPP